MGHLIPTGLPNQGHSVVFDYVGEDEAKKCYMICACSWKIEIGSFRHSWSIMETRFRMRKHMEEIGLTQNA